MDQANSDLLKATSAAVLFLLEHYRPKMDEYEPLTECIENLREALDAMPAANLTT